MQNFNHPPFMPSFMRGFNGGGAAPSSFSLQGGTAAPQSAPAAPQGGGGFDIHSIRQMLAALMRMSGAMGPPTARSASRDPAAQAPISSRQVRHFPGQSPLTLPAPPPVITPPVAAPVAPPPPREADRGGGGREGRGGRDDRNDDRGPGHGAGHGSGSDSFGGPR